MSTLTQRLQFLISADADQAVRAFEKTGAAADRDLSKAGVRLDQLGSQLTKGGAAAMAFAGVAGGALVKAGMNYTNLGVAVGKFADATGISTEAASRWIEVAGDVGIETEQLQSAFVKMEKTAGSTPKVFEDLGIGIERTSSGAVDAAATFQNALSVIGGIEDPFKRADAAAQLFGKGFTSVSELLEMDADQLSAALAAVSDQKVFDAGEVEGSRQMRADIDALVDSFQDIALTIGKGVLPVMSDVAGVITSISGAFDSLPGPVQDAIGGVAGLGVVALGTGGALSVIAGQVIKARDNFAPLTSRLRDADGQLTNVGKAAKVAAGGLVALAAVDVAMGVLNGISDSSGNVTRKLQALTIATGDFTAAADDGAAVLSAFSDAVASQDKQLKIAHIWQDFGKEIKVVGDDTKRNIEDIDAAFDSMVSTSPAQAQTLLDAWRKQAEQLNHTSGQYKDNISLIDRYQERVDLAVGASEALAGGLETAGGSADGLEASLTDLDDTTGETKVSIADLGSDVETTGAKFDTAATKADAFKNALDRVAGGAIAMEEAQRAVRDTATAMAESVDANGTSLDINTAQGRANRAALQDQRDAALDLAAAMIEQGATAEEAGNAVEYQRGLLIAQATQLGMNKGQVEEYLKALGMTPKDVNTGLKVVRQEQAREDIEKWKSKLDDIDPEIFTELNALLDEGKLGEVERRLAELVREREAKVVVRLVDPSWIDDGKANPTVASPRGTSPASSARGTSTTTDSTVAGSGAVAALVADAPTASTNLTYSTSTSTPAVAGGAVDPEQAASQAVLDRLEVIRNKFQAGQTGLATYLRAVRAAQGMYAEWTDEWSGLADEAAAAEGAAASDDDQAQQDKATAREQAILRRLELARNMYAAGKIGLNRYVRAIRRARALYRPWSDEWTRLRNEERAAKRDARKPVAEPADPWDVAANVQAASEARTALTTAAAQAVEDLGDDDSGNDAAALDSWAQAMYSDIAARANVRFKPRSRRWARWVRARLKEAMAENPTLAGRLRVYMLGIPKFPKGDSSNGDGAGDRPASRGADDGSGDVAGDQTSGSASRGRGGGSGSGSGGPLVMVTINTLKADASVGRVVVEAITEYERVAGTRWRNR